MAKAKFRDRYVLATGYPAMDEGNGVIITRDFEGFDEIDPRCRIPLALVHDSKCPRYRLVLERVED
jgi:hypothetical protein